MPRTELVRLVCDKCGVQEIIETPREPEPPLGTLALEQLRQAWKRWQEVKIFPMYANRCEQKLLCSDCLGSIFEKKK